MKKRVLVALIAIVISLTLVAQEEELPADTVAHGSIEESHELTHPAEAEEHGHETRSYFGIPGWLLKLINMVLFLGLLGWLLKGPIEKVYADRKESIRARLSEAEARRERADRMTEEIQERLARVEGEIAAIRERADEEGQRQSVQIDDAAERELGKIREAAKSEIDQRLSQARRELRNYAAELATERARGLVETSITEADRAKLFEESVDQIREVKR